MVPASSPTNWKAMPGKLAHDHKQPQWMHGAICAQTVAVHNLRCECVYNWRAQPKLQVACSSWAPLEDRRQASNRNDHAEHLTKMVSLGNMGCSPDIVVVSCSFEMLPHGSNTICAHSLRWFLVWGTLPLPTWVYFRQQTETNSWVYIHRSGSYSEVRNTRNDRGKRNVTDSVWKGSGCMPMDPHNV